MENDETRATYASNQPMEGEEAQITRGIEHANEQANDIAQQLFLTATEVGALSNLLVERGLISKDDLKAQRTNVARRLRVLFREQQIGVRLDTRIPDKYAIPPDTLPQIDCENRIPLCHAACCAMRFALSAQDLEEGVMRWDLSQPYVNRLGPDKRCVHQDRGSLGCTIYEHRPGVCRLYDCRKDARIWRDFEKRIINPDLFIGRGEGTAEPPERDPDDDLDAAEAERIPSEPPGGA
jgi:Fe-S-cluster containining protein